MKRRVGDQSEKPRLGPVVKARTKEQLNRVYGFWYRVYVEEMGKSFSFADHSNKLLADSLTDSSAVFFLEAEGELIGSVRVTPGDAPGLPPELAELYGLDSFAEHPPESYSFSSRLIVDQKWRGTSVVGMLIMRSFQEFLERGQRFNFAYCSPSLVQLYEQLGMRRYKDNVYDEDVGLRIPLVLLTGDRDRFAAVRSPFLGMARERPQDRGAVDWFNRTFPSKSRPLPTRMLRDEDLWQIFQERLHQTGTPLFKGLSEEEITRFLKSGTILSCPKGQAVMRRGEVGHEMYLILSGAVGIRFRKGETELPLCTFGQGQIFGEMAFLSELPRSADVIALSDLEILVINQRFLAKLVKTQTDLASKVLLNLALVLSDRLRTTTLGLVESADYFRLPGEEHEE